MIVLELCHTGFWLCNMLDAVDPVLLMRSGILRKGTVAFQHNDSYTEVSDIADFYIGTKCTGYQ